MTPKSFTIIAHRGASGTEPENTLRAFRRAARLKCRWIECDVRITRDGAPVIIHDATVNRTTDGQGRVANMMYQALRRLDAGKKEKVPSLKETLSFAKKNKISLVLEIKDPRALKQTLLLINHYQLTTKIIISSFFPSVILRAKKLLPALTTALIIERSNINWVRAAKRARADMVHVSVRLATKRRIERAHTTGFTVWVWTANTKKEVLKLKKIGVDGIFTPLPERNRC